MIDRPKELPSPLLFSHASADRIDESKLILLWAICRYADNLVLATSLGPQSLVILDLLQSSGHQVRTLLLDTGLLFQETLKLKERVQDHFKIEIESVRPKLSFNEIEEKHGSFLWDSDPGRCCAMRKVEPLGRALRGADAWITGIRRSQSSNRAQAEPVEWDDQYHLAKINPLVSWTREDVMDYLDSRGIPYNPLLKEGYPSVGCMPCTNQVSAEAAAADERAGRWAGTAKTECGLHMGTIKSDTRKIV